MIACGVDVVEIKRVAELMERWGETFLNKVFCEEERLYCQSKAKPCIHLAARIAAKEAFRKAVGVPISWRDVELCNGSTGAPYLKLRGRAKRAFSRMGARGLSVSISHTENFAVAVVVLEG